LNKRDVYLFGAGAVIDRKGPTTNCITKRIRGTSHKTKSNQYITDKVFQKLIKDCKLKEE